ncbi:SLC13 family permease [Mobilicoccus caccae]|uniref:GntP family transporter n=1 Tax=Mobilicoccus caccae TaxID=1859295 RepID=A0ABQ6IMU4_9MICO|nr:SLC13 family permease [Mobilicoccus caccae]GMA38077.1 GntP family transporter [Mobilicoccus caccae]
MGTAYLILVGIAAIALLLFLVMAFKWPAYIALVAVSVVAAVAAGMPLDEVIPTVIAGMGGTLGSVALLVGLGAMLGGIVEKTGGAEALARSITRKLGEDRVVPALVIAASLISIPIFYDVAFIILVPLIYSFGKAAGHRSPLILGLPIGPLMVYIHNTVPPHPGITAATVSLTGDVGLLMLVGLAISVPVGVVAYFLAKYLNRTVFELSPEIQEHFVHAGADEPIAGIDQNGGGSGGSTGSGGTAAVGAATSTSAPTAPVRTAPGGGEVLFAILLPVAMIAVGTIGNLLFEDGSAEARATAFIGAPAFALLVACVLSYYLLGVRHHWSAGEVTEIMEGALGPAAVVIFVTGAGGVLAKVLTESGIGDALANSLLQTGIPIIVLAFLLSAAFKVSQGSGTVASQTTAALLASTIIGGDYSAIQIVLILVAIGCGANSLTHVNDSAFWITTKYLGLSVADGFKTWSLMGLVLALTGFAMSCLLWLIV